MGYYDDYLEHGILGWTKKNHKYIKREKGKNGKWKYFYGNLKSKVSKAVQKVKDFFDRSKDTKISELDNDDNKKSINNGKETIEEIGSLKISKFDPKNLIKTKKYKYYKKEEVNGKTRYFYSEKEYNAWLKRQSVLDKDIDGLEDVPSLDKKPTPTEAAKKVDNPNNDIGNCGSCTFAFEMRMRGYDVNASDTIDGTTYDDYSKSFDLKDSDYKVWVPMANTDKKDAIKYNLFYKKSYDSGDEKQLSYWEKDLSNSIVNDGGNNQRGFIIVGWQRTDPDENGNRKPSGGGHIFNYVVENGQVKYYDTQESTVRSAGEIDIKTYLDNIRVKPSYNSSLQYIRIDDKELKSNSKDYISYTPDENNIVHNEPQEYTYYEVYAPQNRRG